MDRLTGIPFTTGSRTACATCFQSQGKKAASLASLSNPRKAGQGTLDLRTLRCLSRLSAKHLAFPDVQEHCQLTVSVCRAEAASPGTPPGTSPSPGRSWSGEGAEVAPGLSWEGSHGPRGGQRSALVFDHLASAAEPRRPESELPEELPAGPRGRGLVLQGPPPRAARQGLRRPPPGPRHLAGTEARLCRVTGSADRARHEVRT